jgi:hypothetical protein
LDLNTFWVGQRYQDVEDTEIEKVRLEIITESQHSDGSGHFGLNGQRDPQNEVLALLNCSGLQDEFFIAIRASRKVAERGDGMALNLLVVSRSKKIHQRLEEARFDDRGFIKRVNGDIANAGNGGEYKRKIGRLEQSQQWRKSLGPDNLQLVFLIGGEVAQSECRLTLDLGGGWVHEMDQGLDQTTLGLSEAFSIRRVDSDVAQGRCTVVLNVDIRRREELDEDGNGTGIDKLLSVVVWSSS